MVDTPSLVIIAVVGLGLGGIVTAIIRFYAKSSTAHRVAPSVVVLASTWSNIKQYVKEFRPVEGLPRVDFHDVETAWFSSLKAIGYAEGETLLKAVGEATRLTDDAKTLDVLKQMRIYLRPASREGPAL